MEPYCLKDKILITKEFLADLESKGWQEIEGLQSQIANIEANSENTTLIQLLKNLLTSYYVFIGGLENLSSGNADFAATISEVPLNVTKEVYTDKAETDLSIIKEPEADLYPQEVLKDNSFEPFEYFVDFDEPTGEPLSDEDLYGTN